MGKTRLFWRTRLIREVAPHKWSSRIKGPEYAAKILTDLTHDSPVEKFVVLILSTQHNVIGVHIVSEGIVDASLVHPREIFRPAILGNGSAILMGHNHPSGELSPSTEDRIITERMGEAGHILGIPMLDHLIVNHFGEWRSVNGR